MITLAMNPVFMIDSGIYTIAGICKNSGKTSFLNWLLAKAEGQALGVLTTGRDGEETDLVFGNPKPSVKLPAQTMFTSTSAAIEQLGSAVEVMQKLPYLAGTKKLWLLKAQRDIETEIVGPANAAAQILTAELMQSYGAEIVLIDGSLDRKSIALHDSIKGVILVAGSSFGTIDKISTELAKLVRLSQITQYSDNSHTLQDSLVSYYSIGKWTGTEYSSILGNEPELMNLFADKAPEMIYLPGAVTDSSLNGIKPALKEIKDIVVKHPLQLHLSKANLEYLDKAHKLYAQKPFRLVAVAVNSWSVRGNHLDSKLLRDKTRQQFPLVPVLDICEA